MTKSSATGLTHFDASGQAHMVDVANKEVTRRIAVATGTISMLPATLAVSDLIPLCHPLAITKVAANFEVDVDNSSVHCEVTVQCDGKTGVEMEALTAASVGLLTIYDMCKAIDRGMTIQQIKLKEKHGGKSGSYVAD